MSHLRYDPTPIVTGRERSGVTYHASACRDCGQLVWHTAQHDRFHAELTKLGLAENLNGPAVPFPREFPD